MSGTELQERAAMHIPSISEGVMVEAVRESLAGVAGRVDARFVEAGSALGRAYQIVEQLVASLEGVSGSLDRESGEAAIDDLRKVADRLTRLPALQAERRGAVAVIGQVQRQLRAEAGQIGRTLSFLRIAGFNIKMAAAGAPEFSGFADAMFEKLDLSEEQMRLFEGDLSALAAHVASIGASEAQLASECARVVPNVPLKLTAGAIALQQHQVELAGLAARIAEVARRIRAKVGTALGAIQIGDITRQRLEHVCAGIALIESGELDAADADAARAAEAHFFHLLAAQTADTLEAFDRESVLLANSLAGIAPEAGELLALRGELSSGRGESSESCLLRLEQSIGEVRNVTLRLHEADAQSDRLSGTTSATAESLTRRLRMLQKVKTDVQQMAWNTDFRCHRMGDEGRALRSVAAEIRGFANRLEALTQSIAGAFGALADAAASMRGVSDGEARVDSQAALAASLDAVRKGADRMRAALAGVDADAEAVAEILRNATDSLVSRDDIAAIAAALGHLSALAGEAGDSPDCAGPLLRTMAGLYTMAREREIHARYALEGETAAAEAVEDDEDDLGLF